MIICKSPSGILKSTEEAIAAHAGKSNYRELNTKLNIGVYETIGFRSQQEDSVFYGILDKNYFHQSDFARQQYLIEKCAELQNKCTHDLGKIINNTGSTAVIAITDGKTIDVANIADSTVYLIIEENANVTCRRLNRHLHKPTDATESKRIRENGGVVFSGRLNGELAVARAIGDNKHKDAISHRVEIYPPHYLNIKPDQIAHLLLACDGLTEAIYYTNALGNDEEYIRKLFQQYHQLPLDELAQALGEKAIRDGSKDNVSLCILKLTLAMPVIIMAVFDGHGGSEVAQHVRSIMPEVFQTKT